MVSCVLALQDDTVAYDLDLFLECPNPCNQPLQIEIVGDAKVFRLDGRLVKDVS